MELNYFEKTKIDVNENPLPVQPWVAPANQGGAAPGGGGGAQTTTPSSTTPAYLWSYNFNDNYTHPTTSLSLGGNYKVFTNNIVWGPKSYVALQQTVYLPDASHTRLAEIQRRSLVQDTTVLTLANGMVVGRQETRPSKFLAVLSIPKTLVTALVPIPGTGGGGGSGSSASGTTGGSGGGGTGGSGGGGAGGGGSGSGNGTSTTGGGGGMNTGGNSGGGNPTGGQQTQAGATAQPQTAPIQ